MGRGPHRRRCATEHALDCAEWNVDRIIMIMSPRMKYNGARE
jgi:hypothetical protein